MPPTGRSRRLCTPGAVAAAGALALVAAALAGIARAPEPRATPPVLPQASVGAPAQQAAVVTDRAPRGAAPRPVLPRLAHADFGGAHAPLAVRRVADWAVAAPDAAGLPFLIVDKDGARLYAFGADGRGRGSTPVLLGLARGDESVPGIGERPLSSIRPDERTTPAGRFVAEPGRNLRGEDIVWIDYDAAVSMHRVRATNPRERRLQRLASPTVADNRISYGCINVPAAFYDGVVRPLFAGGRAVVYVLPERRSLRSVFGPMQAGPAAAAAPSAAPRVASTRPGGR